MILLLTLQCTSSHDFEKIMDINNNWNKNKVQKIIFHVGKAHTTNISFILRNNNSYNYSNIYLFTELETPSKHKTIDTLQYQLALPNGQWIGTGVGNVKENLFIYKKNITLTEKGNYTIRVRQGMRKDNLTGIEDLTLILDHNK